MRIAATSLLHCGQPEWGVRRVILDHDVGLSEAEGGSLFLPAQREVSVLHRDAAATPEGCRPSRMAAVMSGAR